MRLESRLASGFSPKDARGVRRAVEAGIEHGRNIGRRAVERFMRPLED